MQPNDEKYTVQKTKDGEYLEPGTYFVIRSQDAFGIAGLYAYANQLQTILELNETRRFLTDEERDYLADVADYSADLARQWQVIESRKVPD